MLFSRVRYKGIVFLMLMVLAVLVGFIHLSIIPGVDFVFGSIVTVVIILIFGPWWGTLGAVFSSIFTILLWHQPFAFIIFIIEAVILAFAYSKTKKNIVLIDGIFWLLIGAPCVIFFYLGILELSWPAVKLILLKQSLNGIFNSLVGSLIVYSINLYTLLDFEINKIKYSNLIYNVIMLFVLIPTLGYVMYHGQSEYQTFQQKARETIYDLKDDVAEDIKFWFDHHMIPIKKLAEELSDADMDTQELQKNVDLINKALPDLYTVYVADEKGRTFAFAPPINEKGESTIGLDFSDREYYQLIKEIKQPVLSDVFLGRGGVFEPIVTYNVPILRDHHFSGFVNGSIDLNVISRILHAIAREDATITLLDSKRQVIATTDPDKKLLEKDILPFAQHKSLVDRNLYYLSKERETLSKLSLSEQAFFVYIDEHFGDRFNATQTLLIEMPMEPAFTALYERLADALFLALLNLFAAIVFGRFASRMMVVSLQNITSQAEELPDKVTDKQLSMKQTNWPRSGIYEVFSLVNTFSLMEKRLLESFSKIRSNEEKFRYMAHHDALTGLPNSSHFIYDVGTHLQSSPIQKAIVFIDLNRFKVVNDTLGHSGGDKLLIQVSNRLKRQIPEGAFLARQGGDEFVICVDIHDSQQFDEYINRIIEECSKPYDLGDWRFNLTVSIGVSIYPLDGNTVEELMKNADIAMFAAKETGKKGYYLFEEKLLHNIQYKMELEKKLRLALQNKELEIFYQPLVDVRTMNMYGSEALIRWKDIENDTIISPLDFIPLAEETGIIVPIGEWVIRTACKQMKQWQKDTGAALTISVNVSARQFIDEDFVKIVTEALAESRLSPECLTLEITESKVMEHLDVAIKKMKELKLLGVKLALDDFGTGYSSLSYLKQFPLDALKIDRSFISDMLTDKYNESLVKAVMEVAHTLGLSVVAEGVEREEQLEVLRKINCAHFQGYLFSPPLDTQQFEQLILETM